jgi:hypothetical protein
MFWASNARLKVMKLSGGTAGHRQRPAWEIQQHQGLGVRTDLRSRSGFRQSQHDHGRFQGRKTMKTAALVIAAGSIALGSAAEAQTILGIYDNRGGCLYAMHQLVAGDEKFYNSHNGLRPDGWHATYVCPYYNGYYYLVMR